MSPPTRVNEVSNILPVKVQEGDLVLVEVCEGLSDERRAFLQHVLEENADEAGVHFLVLPENTVHDLRRMPLTEMVRLRELLDTFIGCVLNEEAIGEA